MAQTVNENWPFVVNLGNSIIGVAVLAMPFCFKQCGILLGMVVLLFCTWLTLASCQLLVKAGIVSHHRSYEFLAYHTYGAPGKFLVEIGMIGMQLGTLVAQIVVIGDLGPPIVSILLGVENNAHTRVYLMVFLCLAVGLPLGLMKDLRNVSRASTICITFYTVFIVYVLWKSSSNLVSAEWYSHVQFWRPQGLFQCLPIMSFSFGCQTQLFILYDALPDPSLHAIKSIIHSAVNLCAVAYLLVGFFGYVAFYEADIPGDIITVFAPTLASHMIKLGFVMSIAITFPVIIYPCRASIYTLLFQKKSKLSDDVTSTYIPEFLFKSITVTIVVGSMITGILIPNVEFILGLNGAITGTLICYIFPALFFLRVMSSKAEGKIIAQIVLVLGVSILLVSTFTTLYAQDKGHVHEDVQKTVQEAADKLNLQNDKDPHVDSDNKKESIVQPPVQKDPDLKVKDGNERRMEPPNPDAPGPDEKVEAHVKQEKSVKKEKNSEKEIDKRGDSAGDKGKEEQGEQGEVEDKRQEKLLNALESQRKEQEKLLNEQKALLKELQNHKDQHHQQQDAQQQAAGQQGQGLQQGQGQVQGQGQIQQQQQHDAAQAAQPQQKIGLQQAQVHQGVLQQGALGQQAQVNQQGGQPQVLPANNLMLNNPNQDSLGNNGQVVNLQNPAVNNQPQQVNLQNQNAAFNNPAQAVLPNIGLNNQAQQPIAQNVVANNAIQQQAVQNAPIADQPQGPAVLPAMRGNAGGGGNLLQQNNPANNPGQQQGGQNPLGNNPGLNPPVHNLGLNPPANNLGLNQPANNLGLNQPANNLGLNQPANNLGLNQPINNPAQPAVQNAPMDNILQDSINKQGGQFAQNEAANNQIPMPQDKQQALAGVGVEQGMAPQAAGIQADKVQALGQQNGDLVGAAVAAADFKLRAQEEGAGDNQLGDKDLLRKKREAGEQPGHSAAEQSDMVHAVLRYMKEGGKDSAHPLVDPQNAPSDDKLLLEDTKVKKDVKMDNVVEMEGKEETDKANKNDSEKNSPVEGKAGEEQPGADAHKQEMRKLKAIPDEQGGHFGADFEGATDLEVKSFLHSAREGVLIRSLKSKGR